MGLKVRVRGATLTAIADRRVEQGAAHAVGGTRLGLGLELT